MNGLLLRLRRGVRRILRPIQSRSVTLCEVDNSEIVPKKCHIPFYLPFWLRRELRDKFVVSQCFHDVRPEMDLSSSRRLESIVHKIDPCSICTSLVFRTQASSASTEYNALRPVCQTMRALNCWRYFTHLEVLHVSHAADHALRLFAEWVVREILPQVGFQCLSIWMRSELMNQLFDCFLACVIFLLNCGTVALEADSRFHLWRFLHLLEWALDALYPGVHRARAGFRTILLGERGDSETWLKISSHDHHFVNTYHWWSVVKYDRVRSCLIERQSLLPSNPQIGPVHCVLVYFPIVFVHCNSGLRQVVIPLLVWMHGHRIHGCEEYRLSPFRNFFSTRNQS